jgi:protein-S-isoprenylcysteine O-methyltransferase Ste14
MAGKTHAALWSALFLALAPGTVAVLIPWLISGWVFQPAPSGFMLARIFGAMLIVIGAIILLESFARFALHGFGTPSPTFPTRRLIVGGFYRFVRNPMYVALMSTVLGQGLLFWNMGVLAYAGAVWVACHIFVMTYEEPKLRETFGWEYESYCFNVPRWLPRPGPWKNKKIELPPEEKVLPLD